MKLYKMAILMVVCGLFMFGCGNQAGQMSNTKQLSNTGQSSNTEQPVDDAQEKGEVNVSVLTDSTVKNSLCEGMIANDCSTYEKMEEQSDIVVYGEKVREFFRQSEADEKMYELMAEVEIETVIKSNGDSYDSGDRILVCEDMDYFPDYNLIHHMNGYQKMENGKKYYLMLGKEYPEEQNSAYYIIGGVCGKIPEDEKEEIIFETDEDRLQSEEKQSYEKKVARNRRELTRRITGAQSR